MKNIFSKIIEDIDKELSPKIHNEILTQIENHISSINKDGKRIISLGSSLINSISIILYQKPYYKLNEEKRKRLRETIKKRSYLRSIRDLYTLLYTISYATYMEHEKIKERLNYDGSPLGKEYKFLYNDYTQTPEEKEYDVDIVIIGSGAGGSTASYELSKKGYSIILLESGDFVESNIKQLTPFERVIKYYYNSGITFTLGNISINLPFGEVIGGTTTINSGTMGIPPEYILKKWEELQIIPFFEKNLMPNIEEVIKELNIDFPAPDVIGNNAKKLKEGSDKLGIKNEAIKRPIKKCIGQGQCAFVCPYGAKQAMIVSYLKESKENGAIIFKKTKAKKIVFKNKRAYYVEAEHNGKKIKIYAKIFIVSGGAIRTPIILKNSGYKNKFLGKNLKIHPASEVQGLFQKEVYGWKGVMQSWWTNGTFDKGYWFLATFPPPGLGHASVSEHIVSPEKYKYISATGILISDTSSGNVKSIGEKPIIFYNINQKDLKTMEEAIKQLALIYLEAGAKEVYIPIWGKIIKNKKDVEAVKLDPKKALFSAYHPMGTAAMGKVVDFNGKLLNTDNVYVMDASIIPTSTGVNPQLTINAIVKELAKKLEV